MTKLAIALTGLAVTLIGGLFLLPGFIDWNAYKPDLQQAVADATGCPVRIEGDIDLSLLPSPRLSVGSFSLGDDQTMPLLQADGLVADVPLGALISGDIVADHMRVLAPVLSYDGNNRCAIAPGAMTATAGDEATGADTGTRIALDKIDIDNGRLVWTYSPDMAPIEIGSLTGSLSVSAGLERIELAGKGQTPRGAADIQASLTQPAAGGSYRAFSSVNWPADGTKLRITAESADLTSATKTNGRMELGLTAKALGLAPDTLPARLSSEPLDLSSEFTLEEDRITLNNSDMRWGALHLSGATTVKFGPKPNIDTVLSVQPLDLDALLQSNRVEDGDKAEPADADTAPTQAGRAMNALAGLGAGLIQLNSPDYTLGLELSIDALRIGGAVMADTGFHIAVDDGTLTLDHSRIRLPGGSDLSILGFLSNTDGQPRFEGGLSFQSDNLRRFLRWAGIPAGDVPPDRLRSVQIAANLLIEPGSIALPGFSARLDTSNVTGDARLTDQRTLSLSLATDIFNLDAYGLSDRIPMLIAELGRQAGNSAPDNEAPAGDGPALPTSATSDLDWDLRLAVDHLTLSGRPATDVMVKLRHSPGFVAVEEFSVGDFYGIAAQGQANLQHDQIASQLSVSIPSPYVSATRLGAPSSLRNPLRGLGETKGELILAGPLHNIQTDLRFNAPAHRIALLAQTALGADSVSFDLHGSRVSLPEVDLADIAGQATLHLNGNLAWTSLRGSWNGVPIEGSGQAKADANGYDLTTGFTAGLTPLLRSFQPLADYLQVTGEPVLHGNLTAAAGFLDKPLLTLEGKGRFTGSIALAPTVNPSSNRIRQAQQLGAFIQANFADPATPLTGLFEMAGGRITFSDVATEGHNARADFSGWIDFAENRMETNLQLHANENAAAPEFRLQARGDLNYPSVKASGNWLRDGD